jgi:hypothetical protein
VVSWLKRLFGGGKAEPVKVTDREAYITEQEGIDTPWATFEVRGFEDDGRIKVEFNWNSAFIQKIKDLGFQAETEEDSVQLFFYASQMKPTQLAMGDDPVQSEEHPQLSSQQNVLRT